jgi:phage-related protein
VKKIILLSEVDKYLKDLPEEESAKIFADLVFLRMDQTEGLSIKQLKGKIKELIVKQNRVVFFEHNDAIYAVDAFKKQSQKTPKRIIERTEKIYYQVVNKK